MEHVLPEKLTGPQLVKKFPAFYGTRRFITAFTKARHLSTQSQTNPVHALPTPILVLEDTLWIHIEIFLLILAVFPFKINAFSFCQESVT